MRLPHPVQRAVALIGSSNEGHNCAARGVSHTQPACVSHTQYSASWPHVELSPIQYSASWPSRELH
eukprot:4812536-Pyramimonas_sp.AAC.2